MAATAPRPGSPVWLLRHDLRVAWRDFRSGFGALGSRSLAGLLLLVVGVVHAAVWTVGAEVGALVGDPAKRDAAYEAALPFAAFVLLLMLAQTLNGATKLLYARGDLDLLLSSPVSARSVLAARALAVALGAFASAATFVLPLADAGAIAGQPRMLALYPTLAGGALLAAALGVGVTLALFRLIGPRRTRFAAQVLATFVGAGFVIAIQIRRVLPGVGFRDVVGRDGWARAALLLPVRAALGDAGALALWLALALLCFGSAMLLLGPLFARSANAAVGAADASRRPLGRRREGARAFSSGPLPGLRRKERRLIARDPWLVSQVLLQVLYMTPLVALLWSDSRDPALAAAPAIVVVTFQVASSLTWLGLSGEDAPDLLASAPVSAATLRRGKLEAVAGLTFGIVALPLAFLLWAAPAAAPVTVTIGASALCAAVAVQSWHGRPGRRSAFAARHRESKLMALIEMALSLLFGVGAALGVLGSAWALAPLGLAGGLVLWLRPRAAPAPGAHPPRR